MIDKKVFLTGLCVLVAAFLLRKAFVKVFPNKDGSVSSYIGHEAIGYV